MKKRGIRISAGLLLFVMLFMNAVPGALADRVPQEKPDNYIELTFRKGDEETVTASVKTELSKKYKQVEAEQQFRLDSAGECTRIVTSGARKNNALPDSLMTVYIIPAAGGCLVASVHCTVESAEGFGVRLNCIANTIFVPGK